MRRRGWRIGGKRDLRLEQRPRVEGNLSTIAHIAATMRAALGLPDTQAFEGEIGRALEACGGAIGGNDRIDH